MTNVYSQIESYKIPTDLIIKDVKWKIILRSILKGKNLMITGPQGSAKTLSILKAAECFEDRKLFVIPMGASQDPRATLIGNTHYDKEKGTIFSQSLFVQAIQTKNAIILLDEISRQHLEATNILMSPLDYTLRFLRLDEDINVPTIKVAEGVCFASTCNVGIQFTSTRLLDRAFKDRFLMVEMDLLTKDEETKLLSLKFPNVNFNTIEVLATISADIKKELLSDSPRINDIISTRMLIEIVEMIDDGFQIKDVIETIIFPFFSASGGNESERTFIKQLVQRFIDFDSEEQPVIKLKRSKPF